MKIVGIDPGAKGAIVILDFELSRITPIKMPVEITTKVVKGKKRERTVIDFPRLFSVIPFADHVFQERVNAMPKQGVSSVWAFSEANAYCKAAVYGKCHRMPTLVTSGKWKGFFDLSDDKNLSRDKAVEIFSKSAPVWKTPRARILDEGTVEAALIAAYAAFDVLKMDLKTFSDWTTDPLI